MYMYMYLSTAYMDEDFLSKAVSKISSCQIHMQQVSWELNKEDHLILFVSYERSWWSTQSSQGKTLAQSPY